MEDSAQKEKTLKERLEEYHEKIGKAVKIDEFNMKDIQMDLPNQRHYWVGRLMLHKTEIINLQKQRKKAIKIITEKMKKELPVGTHQKTISSAAEENEIVKRIDEKVIEEELLIDYLSKIESNFRSTSYDLKNLIEIVKMETT